MSVEVRVGYQVSERRSLETRHGRFEFVAARDAGSGDVAWLVSLGDITTPDALLARVHSSCVTSETFRGCDCDCVEQLDSALARIAARGRGALFYLFQEGRGSGFLAKARDRMLVQASGHRMTTFDAYAQMGLGSDVRSYGAVTALCDLLGLRAPLRLLTNNPQKLAALERDGVRVAGTESIEHAASAFNDHYVASKRRSGHHLVQAGHAGGAAALPETVSEVPPRALANAPYLVHHASYLLPVRLPERAAAAPLWLRLHAYLDESGGGERVAFTLGDPKAAGAAINVQEQVLLERLCQRAAPAAEAWARALARMADVGAGVAVFLPAGQETGVVDPATRALLAHHSGRSSVES